ncbi:MAG: lysophospholipase L1-like esterase, partial [Planctomycetota bacterium]
MNLTPFTRAVLRLSSFLFLLIGAATSAPAQEPVRIACVGDSITEGNANPDYLRNSWPRILGRMLEAHAAGAYVTGNFGRSGATLLHTGRKPYKDQDVYATGLAFRPDQVLINLGTNDATDVSWSGDVTDFERDLRALISDYQSLESQPRILLSNLTPIYAPFPKEPQYVEHRVEIEATIERLAQELSLEIIDFKTPLLSKPKLFPDGLHPNTAGNEFMAAAAFEKLIGSKAPGDDSLRPKALDPETVPTVLPVNAGKIGAANLSGWILGEHGLEGTGKGTALISRFGIGSGDFHLKARLRMLGQKNSAAGFALGPNFFGFEGASGTVFRNGPNLLGLRLLHAADLLWKRDAWIEFEVIRNGSTIWFLVNGFICEMATIEGPIESLAFKPMRSRMQVANWSISGDLVMLRPGSVDSRTIALPWVDAVRGSRLDPLADWKVLAPDEMHRPSNPVHARPDGSAFQTMLGDPLSKTEPAPTIRELQAHDLGHWMVRSSVPFGDWSAFPGAIVSSLACTPARIRAPIICLAEERSGLYSTLALASSDEGRTWSKPFELPAAVTGHGHHALNLPGERLGIVFMDRHPSSPTRDNLVLWVGTHSDLQTGREGQWTVRLFPGPIAMDTGLEVVGVRHLFTGEIQVDLLRSRGIEQSTRSLLFRLKDLEAKVPTRGFEIPMVDLDQDEGRHVVVDREAGQYLGHVTTSLLPDGKTILAVYPKGHGRGPIVYKRSPDGGRTWSERLPTPASWATSLEVPTIHRLTDPRDGTERLIVWSGLYPAR